MTYDLNDQVPAGLEIDAALASVTIGGSEVSDVITPDPEGFCPTVAIYLFQGGGDVVNVDGSLLFYDDGGEDANYTTEHKGSVTFVPKEGQIISFEFLDFYVNVNDKFTVHDGASTDCTQIANLYSERKDLAPLFSSSPDGCLTVNFSANRPYNRGWAIKVSSIEPVMYTVEKAELTAVADARLLRGSEKAVVACLKIDAQGNRGPVALDKLTFDTTGTTAGTLKGLSVTSSEKLTGYNDTNEIGASETGEIATSAALTFPGSLYLWVRADIAPDAPADAKVQLALSSILSGETEMLAQPTEAVSASLTAGLSGEYTVGTTESDYPTLQAAADALKAGVEGPVTFIIAPGKYTELVRIEEIPGASAANTVTFRSATGNRDDVTLNFEQYSSTYGSTEYGVLTISGADWLTFESLSVTTQQMSFPMLVKVGDHAQHFTMRNCHVYTATGTGYSDPTLVECYVNSDAIPNRNNDYATFENCLFEGGYIGLQLGGTSIVNPKPLPMEVGGLVTGCEFLNQGSKGLYINSESNASILRNYFTADGAQMNSSYYAMDLNRADGDFLIEGNVIELSGIEGQAGIYCRPARGTAEAFPRIINNEIALTGVTGSASGIAVNSESPYLLIANNSIHITGEASGSRCLYLNDKMPEGRIVNNIFDNQAGGYAVRVQKDTYLPVTFTTNMLRTSGTNLAYVAGSDVADLAAWNSAVTDETAFTVADLAFLADNILEPADFTPLAKGTPLPEVTADIAGVARAEQTPTVGAYEATDTSVTPAAAEGYPAVDSVTHESARLSMQANCHGVAQVLVLTADAEAPSVETLAASESVLELRKGRAAALTLTGLKPNTEYKAWVLLTCLRGQVGEPLASEIFMTSYKPTEVATFEDVALAEGVSTFDDGTAHFESFLVQEDETAPVAGSRKVAVMEDTESVITLTNASNLVIDGFWLRNEASLTIEAIRADAATAAETAEATSADTKTLEPAAWRYVNLRDLGEIAGIRLATAGAAAIDDFAGAPAPLEAAVTGGDTRINAGTEVTLTAAVSGGVAPFTYRWTNSLQQELGTAPSLR